MIRINGEMLSVKGTLADLLKESLIIVHTMADNIREAAESSGSDVAEKLKDYADDLTDAVFMTTEEMFDKVATDISDRLDDMDLPEEVKAMLKGFSDYMKKKKGEKDGGNNDGVEE